LCTRLETNPTSRYVKKQFSTAYKATIGADFLSKEVEIDNKLVTLQIWYAASQPPIPFTVSPGANFVA
jgi:Ras-related protein Rab-7A